MFLSNFAAWLTHQIKQERRQQEQLEDLTQTFILEPIYTPSGFTDGGDESEGLDLDPIDDISDSPDWDGEDDVDWDGEDNGDEVTDEGDDSLGDDEGEIVEDPLDLDNDDISDGDIGEEIPFVDESEEGETDADEEISDELDESEEGETDADEEISDELDESEEGETDADEEISDELDESETDDDISDEADESEDTEAETDDDISDETEDEEAGDAEADDEVDDEDEDLLDDEDENEEDDEDEDDEELPFSFSVLDFDRGAFRVGSSGQVGVDFLFDGGAYQGEVAFFSLAGMEEMEFETTEQFIAEAAKRAASGSDQGHIVISVADEGARFTGSLFNEPDWNTGPYQGVKTFNMTPGDEFGVMLVPNGRVSEVVNNPSIGGSRRPLFSLSTANPDDEFHLGQIADLTGDGNTFVFEDKRFEISDYDYDDVIFQIRGAVGDAVYVGDVIAPELDWREDNMGKMLLEYSKPYITPVNNEQWDLGELAELGDDAINGGDDVPSDGGRSDSDADLDDPDEVTSEDTETDDLDEAEDEADVAETDDSDDSSSEESVADSGSSETDESSSSESFDPSWRNEDSSESQADGSLGSETTADDAVEMETPDEVTSSDEVEEPVEMTEDSDEESMVSETELQETVMTEENSDTPPAQPKPLVTPERFEFAKEDQPLVGIIDTGFAENNPDLDYDNITLGRDWVDGDDNPLLAEGEGNEHGTHILGLIAAQQDNGIGIDGINPDAPIWLGRAVGSGEWANSLVEFVDAAVESGQPNAVVNLSMDLTQIDAEGNVTTRYEFTPMEREAIGYARQNGVLLVVAAGNNANVMSVLGQASQEFDNIITVGAAEQFDPETSVWKGAGRTEYSSYGRGLDVMAYGGTQENPKLSLTGDGLGTMAGSSVATGKVTGAVSQVWAANPELSYRQVVEIIRNTATDLGSTGWNTETGAGLLNMTAAVHLAKATKPEEYNPAGFLIPNTWSGEGKVIASERAANPASFSGTVKRGMGHASVYAGPGRSYTFPSAYGRDANGNLTQHENVAGTAPGTTHQFDRWEYDSDPNSSIQYWYRIKDTDYWVSNLMIEGEPNVETLGSGSSGSSGSSSSSSSSNSNSNSAASNNHVMSANFLGQVMAMNGAMTYSGMGTSNYIGDRPYGQTIQFDSWARASTAINYVGPTGTRSDDRWYRIKGTNQWIPAVYISGAPGSSSSSIPWEAAISRELLTVMQNSQVFLGGSEGAIRPASQSPQGTGGYLQSYKNGEIYWTYQNGAVAIWFDTEEEYKRQGGSSGWLGFPTRREYSWNGGYRTNFEGGFIFRTSDQGAKAYPSSQAANVNAVTHNFSDQFADFAAQHPFLGSATSNLQDKGGFIQQNFENGYIVWNGVRFSIYQSSLSPELSGGSMIRLEQPILSSQRLSYFQSRPEYYMSGNIFHNSGWGSSLLGGGWNPANNGGFGTEGNCTWYAHGRVLELGGNKAALSSMSGNANEWHQQIDNGTQIVSNPRPGDIAQWTSNYQNHVAVVEHVNDDGTIVISESHHRTNWDGGDAGTLSHVRTISTSNPDRFIRVPGVQVGNQNVSATSNINWQTLSSAVKPSSKPHPISRFEVAQQAAIKRAGGGYVVGNPISEPKHIVTDNGHGWYQKFRQIDGNIRYLSLQDGVNSAYWIHGDNRKEFDSHGGFRGVLGFPTNDETEFQAGHGTGRGVWQGFSGANGKARIHNSWITKNGQAKYVGSVATWGSIGSLYTDMGGASSWLGVPTRSEWEDEDGVTLWAEFENGRIAHNKNTNTSEALRSDQHPSLQATLNKGWWNLNNNAVTLERVNSPGYIDDNKKTWILIHGWNGKSADFMDLADAIEKYRGDQVLVLDWDGARKGLIPSIDRLGGASSWVNQLGLHLANTLQDLDIAPQNLSFIGHSLGSYIAYETAKNMGGVQNLVVFDPALTTGIKNYYFSTILFENYPYDISQVDFSRYSNWSWGFHTSKAGHASNTRTAHESFRVDIKRSLFWPVVDSHGAGMELWQYMLRNRENSVAQYFGLEDFGERKYNAQGDLLENIWSIDRPFEGSTDWEAKIETQYFTGPFGRELRPKKINEI